jgi:hypothetical protein
MPRPAKRRRPRSRSRTSAPPIDLTPPNLAPKKINTFLLHLGRTGSVTFAAARAGLSRRALYKHRAAHEAFAGYWEEALNLGVERLQDDAMRRALQGTERAVFRNGKQVGSVQQFDNRLLQFLLKAHRPETYGERGKVALSPLPFDLAQRLAAARPRADAYDKAKQAEEKQHAPKTKKQGS